MSGYMHIRAILKLYEALKPGSKEDRVDALWANILPIFFPILEDFVTETQPHPKPSTDLKEDVRVRYVEHKSDKFKPLLVIENKRTEFETQGAVWDSAAGQLLDYLEIERETARRQGFKNITLYGAVTVGRYSKFYIFPAEAKSLQPFESLVHLEFKKDEAKIVAILKKIYGAASRPPSRAGSASGVGSRPGSRGNTTAAPTGRPGSSGSNTARPGSSGTTARPGATTTASRPSTTASRPGSSGSTRPGSSGKISGSR
ncbi:hypothetical protein QC761_607680 [Podospora bellae-mahoneyi]|uniref:Uncharacterized protein n=1 Tax=Podospora bellae-mahoneyi TaxID=2093777 RepID=A0ABR0FGP8_9PEZI|nr:hypothetical protein QC761_607680 [Podospora bellae-mahoneyi]